MAKSRSVRLPAAGLLPAFFVAGVTVAAPFAGTTTATVADKHPAVKPAATAVHTAVTPQLAPVIIDPGATTFLVDVYLSIAGLAVLIIVFAILFLRGAERRENRRTARAAAVWTDGFTSTVRSGRSPERAPRVALRRSLPAASAQRG